MTVGAREINLHSYSRADSGGAQGGMRGIVPYLDAFDCNVRTALFTLFAVSLTEGHSLQPIRNRQRDQSYSSSFPSSVSCPLTHSQGVTVGDASITGAKSLGTMSFSLLHRHVNSFPSPPLPFFTLHQTTVYPPCIHLIAMSSTLRAASNAIPTRLKPPLLVLLGVVLSTASSYFASPWIGEDVIAIQRPMNKLSDYTGLVGWRIVELICLWAGGWDGMSNCLSTEWGFIA